MNNPTHIPSVNSAVSGFVFQSTTENAASVDPASLQHACIDLISKLENSLAAAREMSKDDFVDESANVARQMLESLSSFSDTCLSGDCATQAREEIDRAMGYADTFDEVLNTRPLMNALIRTFWTIEEVEDIKLSHCELGNALIQACAATFYHAVMLIGLDNKFGKEIDQSTVIFINELQQIWN